jgi:leader peptidase (prepilin peptidase)/N-methyltransferase
LYLVGLIGEFILRKEAMGGGDVKMMAMVGAFTGWPGALFTIFMGSIVGSLIFGWINYVLKREKLVPFGIFLALGAGVYVFFGQWLIEWYLGFFSPEAMEFFFSGE